VQVLEAVGANGQLAFDGATVTITRNGVMGRLTAGKGEKRIPVRSITAVQWKPPGRLTRGFIQFTIIGGSESRSMAGRRTADAAKDENSVLFGSRQVEAFEAIRDAIDAAIANG
jgi:hypothetical protein